MYDKAAPFPVYCMDCWNSDKWDGHVYARDYDFSRPFFEQFIELNRQVPRVALIQLANTNSPYTNRTSNNKDAYLVFRSNFNENVMYGSTFVETKDSMDCLGVHQSELCYECIDCMRCYGLRYSQECNDSRDSYFLYNCSNCSNCFGCVNLKNKQYHMFNKPYSKEEYELRFKDFLAGGPEQVVIKRQEFDAFRLQYIHKHMVAARTEDVSGNWLYDAKNVQDGYICRTVEDSKHIFGVVQARDCMDYFYFGRNCELVYETASCGYDSTMIRFSNLILKGCSNLEYCDHCNTSQNCFGCVGLKNSSFCILNKQYSKEEFEALRKRIINHMDETPYKDERGRMYRYGEFFPTEVAAVAYNETAAQDYFPFTKDAALAAGYEWRDSVRRGHTITLAGENVPATIEEVRDEIVKEVIGCAHDGACGENCTTAFKIAPKELALYRKLQVPLPRLCPSCRHTARTRRRNQPRLWQRECMCGNSSYENTTTHSHHSTGRCPNKFETTYASERTEIVYCEPCYRAEVL